MEKYLEKFGSNFIVASLVPSVTFITICIAVFWSQLPDGIQNELAFPATLGDFGKFGLIVLLLSIVLGYTLASLNTFILKVYEGYILLEHLPWLLAREKRRARKIVKELTRLKRKIGRLTDLANICNNDLLRERYDLLIRKTSQDLKGLAVDYQSSFATDPSEIMPTKFGNILKAAELYSNDRYGMDSVILWPRLIYVIDPKYYDFIEESNNELSFLVNCSFLSLMFSLVTIPASAIVIISDKSLSLYYFSVGMVGIFAAILFHRASLVSLSQYGEMIKSAYDLFRFKLIMALGHPIPVDLVNERAQWEAVCEFMKIGDFAGKMRFSYSVPGEEKKEKPLKQVFE